MVKKSPYFSTRCHAKCILSGEYSVIHGGAAVVMPVKSRYLNLCYWRTDEPLKAAVINDSSTLLLKSVLGSYFPEDIKGRMEIATNFPLSSGLGGSATICVALARWLAFCHSCFGGDDSIFQIAHTLEHNFHGKSSGMDIAGVLADEPIIYRINQPPELLKATWQPHLKLTHTGLCAATKTTSIPFDLHMNEASEAAIHALRHDDFDLLQSAMKKAHDCFQRWSLIPPQVAQHIQSLYDQGAAAVKPTGSGNGGYVLSLWDDCADIELFWTQSIQLCF